VSYQIVLTKHDEVKVSEREQVIEVTLAALARRPAAYPQLVFTSSQQVKGLRNCERRSRNCSTNETL